MIQTVPYAFYYIRRRTVTVNIGNIPMGSNYPVRIQSMANSLTSDIDLSVAQCIRIAEAGADYVRFTVPSITDANAFSQIKKELRAKGYSTPLIADVHFNPDIALKVAEYADKVRINPGNFSDKNKFKSLVEKCRVLGKAIRIGVNHGSLSQTVMDKFGDTPLGMAESALEYLRICRELNFNQVVVSMKSSNVRVMIYATRLIADMMDKEGMPFPLHLGVTEAGEGEDGRIKSAVGIGTLLSEGLGDTIRVSLTEEPEAEIPVATLIVRSIQKKEIEGVRESGREGVRERGREGEKERGSVGERERGRASERERERARESEKGNDPVRTRVGERESGKGRYEFYRRNSRLVGNIGGGHPVVIGYDQIDPGVRMIKSSLSDLNAELIAGLESNPDAVLVYTVEDDNVQAELKWLRYFLKEKQCNVPVIFRQVLNANSEADFLIRSSVCLGGAIIDGFGDGLWLENENAIEISKEKIASISLGILQACRARMSKTEFISCPSCGRTNFNLIETLARIRKATGHLKGLKIGVMGCIVNGPGEMADADYGYVGSGMGRVTLYKAKEIVKRAIPEGNAVEELVALIKENGDWVEETTAL
jgi:(E)-4-hydroxy-3-methylbut-2-enyl-diphosphate synthase